MKIFGHPMSTCTRRVLATLVETNTPYELVLIDFAKGEHKQPAHVARQPFGKVPTLDDDGFTMYESRAMCRYINEKAGGKLVPSDIRGRAVMEQWISIEASYFMTPTMTFAFQHVFQRPQEPAKLEAAQKELDVTMPVLDAHLAKHAYFAGADFSLADISFMPYVDYGMMTPLKDSFDKYASFTAWWSRVSERPSWRKVTGRA
ncbi:MAG TPA: glutathione S-transferase N-terminal domain-containing protein [Kofleriaceae bacterium]|nr:glutathione S-transferase N-terminal domain-containing protein [Kofleriaceae bacterium]